MGLTQILFPGVSGMGVKVTTPLYLVQRSRTVEFYLHFPIRFNGVVLN
jgi:hypothetical protein